MLSCAQIVPLSGGDKDVEHPKEVESFPKNGSINFNENQISIEFDEFIQLQNLQSQLIISPLMEEKPEISVKGKKLIIKLKDTLSTNTTYSLNFGEAIVDITENNPFPNYKYVFSTGDFVDSLSYSGSVVNAFDLTPKEKMFVLLYNQFEDSVPYKILPRYVAITDKEGHFSITNIALGNYKAFAINDINSNYLFDLPNEEIAFLSDKIEITNNEEGALFYAFEEYNVKQYLVKSENKQYSNIRIILNQKTEKLTIEVLEEDLPKDWGIIERNETNDTVNVWLTKKLDKEKLTMVVSDTGGLIDTASINLMKDKKFEETKLLINSNVSKLFELNQSVVLTIQRPSSEQNFKAIKLIEDSVEVNFGLNKLDSVNRKFAIHYPFKENKNYQLLIPKGAFTDYFGLSNDTMITNFKTKAVSDYGTIALTVTPNFEDNYIVQLRKKDKVIREHFFKGENKIDYDFLAPGNYGLKLIIDKNNDQNWTTGKYIENIQPEKVIYYEKDIVLKANWDNEIKWIIKD